MSIEDEYDGLKALISLGKERGYLLYDEVNEALSKERLGSEDLDQMLHFLGAAGLDQMLHFLGAAGIEVIDSEHRFEGSRQKIDGEAKGEDQPAEWTPERLGRTTDPVRIYLREMATVPLLNQGQEVELAKRIENAQMNVLKAVSRCPLAVAEILDYGKALCAGKTPITKLVNVDKEGRTEENLAARRKDVLERIAEIERLETKGVTGAFRIPNLVPRSLVNIVGCSAEAVGTVENSEDIDGPKPVRVFQVLSESTASTCQFSSSIETGGTG